MNHAKKELRIAMIGYGFMGKTHSNAYKKVGHFFPSLDRVHKAPEALADTAMERNVQLFYTHWNASCP